MQSEKRISLGLPDQRLAHAGEADGAVGRRPVVGRGREVRVQLRRAGAVGRSC